MIVTMTANPPKRIKRVALNNFDTPMPFPLIDPSGRPALLICHLSGSSQSSNSFTMPSLPLVIGWLPSFPSKYAAGVPG
jgi:hypothetical protein